MPWLTLTQYHYYSGVMGKILPITKDPDPILRKRSVELSLEEIGSVEMQELISDMIETMWDAPGIGIAAVQVHVLKRIMLITDDEENAIVLINPSISSKSLKKEQLEQGCLSVPGYRGVVKRPLSVQVKGLDREGKPIQFTAEGLISHIVQHELDHLNGILFTDRAKKVEEEDKKIND